MRRYKWGARVATVVVVGAATLGVGAASWAASPSFVCRLAIAKAGTSVAKTGYSDASACRKAADKASQATGSCDVPSSSAPFDPKGKYAGAKSKGTASISAKCLSGDPVLDNYDGGAPAGAIFPEIDSTINGNQVFTAGNANLGGDKVKIKCVETIVKSEAGIIKEIIQGGTKCQKLKDASASSFGALDPSCLLTGTKSVPKATAAINKACGTLQPSDVGTCSPLPGCVTDNTVSAAQDIVQAIYMKKTVNTCGNGTLDAGEQCDDGANNGTPGDLCNTKCESLAETCGPGTTAGGNINGSRIITVNLNVPAGHELAGVQIGFDYPQLEASIKGTGQSSVVRSAVQVFPTGGLFSVNDTDTDFSFALASQSGTEFIGSGPLFQATLDECVTLDQNVCNRNQNVIGCCPLADIDKCTDDQNNIDDPAHFAAYYNDCKCGNPLKGVSQTDCTTGWKFFADHGACTAGVCASAPATIKCGHGCTAGGSDKINHACTTNANCFDAGTCDLGSHLCTAGGSDKVGQACSANVDCFDAGVCDVGGTNTCTAGDPSLIGQGCSADSDCDSPAGVCDLGTETCTAGEPTKIGTACAANTDCDSAAGVCSSTNICTAGDPPRLGLACSINNDCGILLDAATCTACPELGDRTNGTFGCPDVYNSVICKPGDFPAQSVGGCDGTANGPLGGCPVGNTCEKQSEVTSFSCSLTNPVDHLGQPVDGVTCSIDVQEGM